MPFRDAFFIVLILLAFWANPVGAAVSPAQAQPQTPAQATAPAPAQTRQATPQEILDTLNKEAAAGKPEAMVLLGIIAENADMTSRDYGVALDWYKKAAAKNSADGYFRMGLCYETGMGTKTDLVAAFQNFQKAAQIGLPFADFKVSQFYMTGLGVPQDIKKGFEHLTKSANANFPQAINEMGVVNFLGQAGQKVDQKKAYDYFVKAADLGSHEAMLNLGVIFRDGEGQPINNVQALKWFSLAAHFGNPNPSLQNTIKNVREKMKEDEVAKADKEANAWVETYAKKVQATQAAAQAKAQNSQAKTPAAPAKK
jgi:hypothetical protein